MKQIKTILFFLLSLLIISIPSKAFAADDSHQKLYQQLEPYLQTVQKLNDELGSDIKIPDEKDILEDNLDADTIYSNILNMSVSEFEQKLRKEYAEFHQYLTSGNQPAALDGNDITITIKTSSGTYYKHARASQPEANPGRNAREAVIRTVQRCYLSQGQVILTADIIPNRMIFDRYISAGSHNYTDREYFKTRSASAVFKDNRRICEVTYKGSYYTPEGFELTSNITLVVPYPAGVGDIYEYQEM